MIEYWTDFLAASAALGLLAAIVAFAWQRAGILILGPALFFGVGAYAVAFTLRSRGSWVVGASVGILSSLLLAWIVGRLTLSREGGLIRFSASVLVMSLVAEKLSVRLYDATGGSNGILVYTHPIGLFVLSGDRNGAIGGAVITLSVAIAFLFVIYRVSISLAGRTLLYLRDSPDELVKYGVDIGRARLAVAVIAAGVAAVAGAMYAPASGIVSPEVFSVSASMQCLAWIVIGGMNPLGAFVATFSMRIVEVQLGAAFADWYLLGIAAILVIAVLRHSTNRLQPSFR
jgi:branched-chain amino acid transport system permease protein